tara:strand:+ start:119 stop:331 length:213 start_codon:yes stop_codon:yes gene_type:complete
MRQDAGLASLLNRREQMRFRDWPPLKRRKPTKAVLEARNQKREAKKALNNLTDKYGNNLLLDYSGDNNDN